MLDHIIDICSCFDWISPIIAAIQDLINGPSYTFHIPEGCGWIGLDIERLLEDHGVRIWGKMVFNRTILFTVRLAQARWTQYLLQREGIPVDNPFLGRPPRKRRKTRSKTPAPSPMGTLAASLDRLEGVLHKLL